MKCRVCGSEEQFEATCHKERVELDPLEDPLAFHATSAPSAAFGEVARLSGRYAPLRPTDAGLKGPADPILYPTAARGHTPPCFMMAVRRLTPNS